MIRAGQFCSLYCSNGNSLFGLVLRDELRGRDAEAGVGYEEEAGCTSRVLRRWDFLSIVEVSISCIMSETDQTGKGGIAGPHPLKECGWRLFSIDHRKINR